MTEMVVKTAAFVLKEAYDQYRLWALSPRTVRFSRELNLLPVLGFHANVNEYLCQLRVIEATDFTVLPI